METDTTIFEGPEKKLEIILSSPDPNLRSGQNGRWLRVVAASGAQILSRASTPTQDAYLLSESSLFVWRDGILMITCGRTRLIDALDEVLGFIPGDRIGYVFYERKNLMYPEDQPADFETDVARLLPFFPGKSYRLGPANHDHLHVFYYWNGQLKPEKDATLQILMNDLDPAVIKLFSLAEGVTPEAAGKRSGLTGLYPNAVTDGYLFAPCGYSMNGLLGNHYFTAHVTPQSNGSYASFETNVIHQDYGVLIGEVIDIFRPAKFSLVLTTTLHESYLSLHPSAAKILSGYRVTEKSMYEFDSGYAVTFSNHHRISR